MKQALKFLSLVLAVSMVLTMLPMKASAAFTDEDDIYENYSEAVDVLSGLGVMEGDTYESGGTAFNPQQTLTRGEIAAILYRIITGDVDGSYAHTDSQLFDDVPTDHHYAGYINFCIGQGLMDAYGDGNFYPTRKVTGYQALAMILGAIGYDQNGEYQGAGWESRVLSDAQESGLLSGFTADFDVMDNITREQAANMFYNALQSPMVENSGGSYVPTGKALGAGLDTDIFQAIFRSERAAQELQNNNFAILPRHSYDNEGNLSYLARLRPGQTLPEGTDNVLVQAYTLYDTFGVQNPSQVQLDKALVNAAAANGAGIIVNATDFAAQLQPDGETENDWKLSFTYKDGGLTISLEGAKKPVDAAVVLRTGETLRNATWLVDENGNAYDFTGVGVDRKSIYASTTLGKEPQRFTAKTNAEPLEVVPIEDILANDYNLASHVRGYNNSRGTERAYAIANRMKASSFFTKDMLRKNPITLGELLDAVEKNSFRKKLEMAVQEAVTRYPALFPGGISTDDELTGEQLVAIFAVLKGWYTDLEMFNKEASKKGANNSVPQEMIETDEEEGISGGTPTWAEGWYGFDAAGNLVYLGQDGDGYYFYLEGTWYDREENVQSGVPSAPVG